MILNAPFVAGAVIVVMIFWIGFTLGRRSGRKQILDLIEERIEKSKTSTVF